MDEVGGGIPNSAAWAWAADGKEMGFWRNRAVSAWGVLSCSAGRKRGRGSRGVPWSLGLGLLLRTLDGKP